MPPYSPRKAAVLEAHPVGTRIVEHSRSGDYRGTIVKWCEDAVVFQVVWDKQPQRVLNHSIWDLAGPPEPGSRRFTKLSLLEVLAEVDIYAI